MLDELQGKIAHLKEDRKIPVGEIEAEDREATRAAPSKSKSPKLLTQNISDRLERIFGPRFLVLSRLEEILHVHFGAGDCTTYNDLLINVWKTIFESEALKPLVERNYVKTLQKTFRDYVLIFRSPILPSKTQANQVVPCTIESLRSCFGAYFMGATDRTLWYSRLDFYRQPVESGHWALLDRQYLNCTFRKPATRLLMYARANEISPRLVRQKSAVEDIYDRIVVEMALKDRFFSNCNALTSTTYQPSPSNPKKQVYIYFKDHYIRISGKKEIPHWRINKPRWPDVLPAIIFSPQVSPV